MTLIEISLWLKIFTHTFMQVIKWLKYTFTSRKVAVSTNIESTEMTQELGRDNVRQGGMVE